MVTWLIHVVAEVGKATGHVRPIAEKLKNNIKNIIISQDDQNLKSYKIIKMKLKNHQLPMMKEKKKKKQKLFQKNFKIKIFDFKNSKFF